MADYGMKVSRQGFDVATAADHQLLWSSSFHMPVVIGESAGTVADGTTKVLITHNLGFYPVSLTISRGTGGGQEPYTTWDTSERGKGLRAALLIGTDNITTLENQWGEGRAYHTYVFNSDLEASYTAPIINNTAATQGEITTDYGWKVSGAGTDVGTANYLGLLSYSGNSQGSSSGPTRHQIIHMTGTVLSNNGGTTSVAHGLGYKPMHMWYQKQTMANGTGYFQMGPVLKVGFDPTSFQVQGTYVWRQWCDDTNINIYNNSGNNVSLAYLILKDPFD